MRYHAACELFPRIKGEAFQELVASLKANGFLSQFPIFTLPVAQGEEPIILDGRNRYEACQEAGVEPVYKVYEGPLSPEAFILSVNVHRRHLTVVERAMAAAELLRRMEGARVSQVAEAAGVAPSILYQAVAVKEVPEGEAAVKAEEVSLEDGAAIADYDLISRRSVNG